jgi:hypothetical protein
MPLPHATNWTIDTQAETTLTKLVASKSEAQRYDQVHVCATFHCERNVARVMPGLSGFLAPMVLASTKTPQHNCPAFSSAWLKEQSEAISPETARFAFNEPRQCRASQYLKCKCHEIHSSGPATPKFGSETLGFLGLITSNAAHSRMGDATDAGVNAAKGNDKSRGSSASVASALTLNRRLALPHGVAAQQ